MDGNKKTLKEIDDAVNDANTDIFNQPLHVNLNISNRAFISSDTCLMNYQKT